MQDIPHLLNDLRHKLSAYLNILILMGVPAPSAAVVAVGVPPSIHFRGLLQLQRGSD